MAGVNQSILDKIASTTGGSLKPCIECGHGHYAAHDEIAFVPIIKLNPGGNNIDVGTGQAFVTLSCAKCGLSKFYNAATLGL